MFIAYSRFFFIFHIDDTQLRSNFYLFFSYGSSRESQSQVEQMGKPSSTSWLLGS